MATAGLARSRAIVNLFARRQLSFDSLHRLLSSMSSACRAKLDYSRAAEIHARRAKPNWRAQQQVNRLRRR